MMRRRICCWCVSLQVALAAAATASDRESFERLAEVAVTRPPELRAATAKYSTNRLDFCLNNGLACTCGGRLWASWISGGDGTNSYTVIARSDDRGETWTDSRFVIDGHDGTHSSRTNIIGTFWLDPDGRLRCYTDQTILHFDGRAGFWEAVCESPDAPEPKWSAFRRIGDGHVINKPIVLKNGDWALASYLNGTWKGNGSFRGAFSALDSERGATCWVSSDRGRSWQKRGTVRFPESAEGVEDWQESQLVESLDGKTLRMFARVIDGKHGCLMSAESVDGGRTWTKPHRLPNLNNANARFQIVRLQSGRLICVKHGTPAHENLTAWDGRYQLTAYLSDDDGETWKGGLLLDPGYGTYPDLCQAADGTIFVTQDHGRENGEIRCHRFTEADILAGKQVTPGSKLRLVVMRSLPKDD